MKTDFIKFSKVAPTSFIFLILLSSYSFGQTIQRSEDENDTYAKVITRAGSFTYSGSKPVTKGSVYLYDNWDNFAIIQMENGEKAKIESVNYNIDTQHFETKFKPDSTYQFNLENVAIVYLNNHQYKQFDYEGEKKIFEIVYEESAADDFAILKGYVLNVFLASNDPMANRPNDTYTKRKTYYEKEGDKIKIIHLNKKNILRIFKSKNISKDEVENHVKENDLSYKDELDVDLLFQHFFNQ